MTRYALYSSLLMTLALGCGEAEKPGPAKPPAATSTSAKDAHDHDHSHGHDGHEPGPHQGTLADWGGGKYHVEFTVDHDKQEATVYILGDDEKSAVPIKASTILLSIKSPKFQIELAAAPLDGEAEGTASRFVGKHESLGKEQEFSGSIGGEVDGTPYVGDFKEGAHGDHSHK